MERENSDLSSTLVKKEQDLEAKAQEKEDLQSNLERAKEKLELELQRANEARHRLGQMDNHEVHSIQGCQMAIARFLDRMCMALRASGLWLRYATLQNLIPSFPWIAPQRPPPWHNQRKGRDKILPSGNTGQG